MITAPAYEGKAIGVFGLARSGLATVHALVASGAMVYAWDDNQSARDKVSSCAEDLYSLDFSILDALVLAPGVPLTHPEPHPLVKKAKSAAVPLISDLDVFQTARAVLPAHKVIGITGTNGKSTTTTLIGHILSECGVPVAVGGNIGTGVLALDALQAGGVYIFELSSFQLDLTADLKCDVGVLLNLSPDHLDRHGTMAGYAAVKAKLFEMQPPEAASIIGVDDQYCIAIADRFSNALRISGGAADTADIYAEDGVIRMSDDQQKISSIKSVTSLQGEHNWQNAAAAFAAARACGLSPDDILEAMKSFPGLEHRQEVVSARGGILVINDSKATNVDAASRALRTFDKIRWIAGGRAKDKDFGSFAAMPPSVKKAYLMGEHGGLIADILPASLPREQFATMAEAIERAFVEVEAGDTILLSPACTAFDQFANFEERGNAFKAAVASRMEMAQ